MICSSVRCIFLSISCFLLYFHVLRVFFIHIFQLKNDLVKEILELCTPHNDNKVGKCFVSRNISSEKIITIPRKTESNNAQPPKVIQDAKEKVISKNKTKKGERKQLARTKQMHRCKHFTRPFPIQAHCNGTRQCISRAEVL